MPLPLINILNEHQKRYKAIDGYSDNLRICGGIKCLRDTTIEKRNEKFAEYCKMSKKYAFNDFRHSHASLLANNGIKHSRNRKTFGAYQHRNHLEYILSSVPSTRRKSG